MGQFGCPVDVSLSRWLCIDEIFEASASANGTPVAGALYTCSEVRVVVFGFAPLVVVVELAFVVACRADMYGAVSCTSQPRCLLVFVVCHSLLGV